MSNRRRNPSSSKRPEQPEEAVYLREHCYVIDTADQYFDVQKRIRHARYALDSLLDGKRLYGDTEEVEPLFDTARGLRQRYQDLEPKAAPPQRVDGRLVRIDSPLESGEFQELTEKQVNLWQQAELVLAQVYELMASSLERQLLRSDNKIPELQIFVSLLQFHGSKRMDQAPPLRTYTFDLCVGERFAVSFEDNEPRRRRAETWYDQVLESTARLVDAQRKQNDSTVLIRLTWVITILTIVVAVFTAATLCIALAPR